MRSKRAGEFMQQGDVLFIPCAIPAGARKITQNVLAEGEHTGHSHTVLDPAGCGLETYEHEGELYVKGLLDDLTITHQEHRTQVLPKGVEYKIRRVQEYDHFAQEARRVLD